MHRGAGRGPHARTDRDVYPGSKCAASLGDRDARDCADPGDYLDSECAASLGDCNARRDRHTSTDLNAYSNYSARRLLAGR